MHSFKVHIFKGVAFFFKNERIKKIQEAVYFRIFFFNQIDY